MQQQDSYDNLVLPTLLKKASSYYCTKLQKVTARDKQHACEVIEEHERTSALSHRVAAESEQCREESN